MATEGSPILGGLALVGAGLLPTRLRVAMPSPALLKGRAENLRAALGDALPMTRKALDDVIDQLDRLAVLLQEGVPASLRQAQALTPIDSAFLAALDALAVVDLPDVSAVRAKLKPLVAAWQELRTGSAVVAVTRTHAPQTTTVGLLAEMRHLSIASWLV